MNEAIYRFARWFFGMVGLIPAVEARRSEKFEETLAMLLPTDEDREQFREGVIMFAQAGLVSYDDMALAARAWARGQMPEEGTE